MKRAICILLILAVLAGIVGAGLSVAMLIRAVQWSEWGRVVLYCVTLAACVEMAVIAICRLRQKDDD